MLTTTLPQFQIAQKQGRAVGAFNIFNLESAQAVIAAAEQLRAPVILQINSGAANHGGWHTLAAIAIALARESRTKVSLHLDHGLDLQTVRLALRLGFTSIMFDGSPQPLAANIRLTRQVVRLCKPNRIPVEGEVGQIHGVEDDLASRGAAHSTDPDTAARFVQATGCHSFAPAIGNAHGIYPSAPHLDFRCLAAIHQRIPEPLVLHGGSGLSRKCLRQAIRNGVLKINFSTELREAFTASLLQSTSGPTPSRDPRKHLAAARQAVQDQVRQRLADLGWQ